MGVLHIPDGVWFFSTKLPIRGEFLEKVFHIPSAFFHTNLRWIFIFLYIGVSPLKAANGGADQKSPSR